MTEELATAAERVAAGVAWLDAEAPGWREHVQEEVTGYSLGDPSMCVLGRVAEAHPEWRSDLPDAAPYWRGVLYATGAENRWADSTIEWGVGHGFNWRPFDGEDRQAVVDAWNDVLELGAPAAL